MTDTAKRLIGPVTLTNSATTVYTVPALTTTIMRNLRVCNTTAVDDSFTLSLGTDSAGSRLYDTIVVPARGIIEWSGFTVLTSGEKIQSRSGTTGVLTLTVSGVEIS